MRTTMQNGRAVFTIMKREARAPLALAILALVLSGTVARADELQSMRNVGDGYKSVRVITRYDLDAETRTMTLTAAQPSDFSIGRQTRVDLATRTAHEICANRAVKAGWTVRISLDGESSPVASCKAGAGGSHKKVSAKK